MSVSPAPPPPRLRHRDPDAQLIARGTVGARAHSVAFADAVRPTLLAAMAALLRAGLPLDGVDRQPRSGRRGTVERGFWRLAVHERPDFQLLLVPRRGEWSLTAGGRPRWRPIDACRMPLPDVDHGEDDVDGRLRLDLDDIGRAVISTGPVHERFLVASPPLTPVDRDAWNGRLAGGRVGRVVETEGGRVGRVLLAREVPRDGRIFRDAVRDATHAAVGAQRSSRRPAR
ncbi:MAG: hypothetical protein AB7G37_12585 [Solirubrobacteraceae bacterium]